MVAENIRWILHNSVSDVNYNVSRLTDDELAYCLEHETRKTGISKLLAEVRRRQKKRG